jgi:hypothetical protein
MVDEASGYFTVPLNEKLDYRLDIEGLAFHIY